MKGVSEGEYQVQIREAVNRLKRLCESKGLDFNHISTYVTKLMQLPKKTYSAAEAYDEVADQIQFGEEINDGWFDVYTWE